MQACFISYAFLSQTFCYSVRSLQVIEPLPFGVYFSPLPLELVVKAFGLTQLELPPFVSKSRASEAGPVAAEPDVHSCPFVVSRLIQLASRYLDC